MHTNSLSQLSLLVAGVLALLLACGCARHNADPVNPHSSGLSGEYFPTHDNAGSSINTGNSTTAGADRYHRDADGHLYYVDRNGTMHFVERKAVVPSQTGNTEVYYLRGDDRPHYSDEYGRLFYRDQGGRVFYIDETEPGTSAGTVKVIQGYERNRVIETRDDPESCSLRWERCTSGCNELSRASDRRQCKNRCTYERDQCNRRF